MGRRNPLAVILFWALMLSPAWLFGQIGSRHGANNTLADFTARQLGQGVILDWRVVQGQFCFDMEIQRTEDTTATDWIKLGEVGGLCGSNFYDAWYEWYDDSPLNANSTYYYRIWASNGTIITRSIALTFRDTEIGKLLVVPNPVDAAGATAYYTNPLREEVRMSVYDMQGAAVLESEASTRSEFRIDGGQIGPGIYLVHIRRQQDGGLLATQRIFVR